MLSKVTGGGENRISIEALAELLRTTREELASTAGLTSDAGNEAAQRRLREMVAILERIEAWHHSPLMAYAWYRDVTLPGFAGQTAEMLVRSGQAQAVLDYLDELAQGSYA